MKKFKYLFISLFIVSLFFNNNVYALTKEENVYVKLNDNGSVNKVSIYEHLFDYDTKYIRDRSLLDDINNVNGNEKYNKDREDIVWETNGNDIYYKGNYNDNLPISMDVKYYLNDEEKDVDDILGKSGSIKIVISYKNNNLRNINNQSLYVPYFIISSTILNNNTNKNIRVFNGKIIDNGVNSMIVGISSPGLYESLDIDKLKNFNKVEISYDTDDFKLNSIYSIATTDLFNNSNLDMLDNINNLYNSIDLLQSNMNTIVDASKKLSDGSNEMNDGTHLLNIKIQELVNKYKYYRNIDQNKLKEEIINLIEENIKTITPSLEKEVINETSKIIKENKEDLEESVITYTTMNTKKVIDEEVDKVINELKIDKIIEDIINSNLYNLLKNDKEINDLSNMFREDINNKLRDIIQNELNRINNSINNNMSPSEREAYINNIAQENGISYEQAERIVNKVQTDTLNGVRNNINNSEVINNIINNLNNSDYINNLVNSYINDLNNKISNTIGRDTTIKDYSNELKDKIIDAIEKDLDNNNTYINKDVKKYLDKKVDEIINNTATELSKEYTEKYTNEVVKRVVKKEFSKDNIDSNIRKVLVNYEDNINKLDDNINNLSDSLNKLDDGSSQISNGMNLLSNGLDKYNKEGINKISKLVNGNVKNTQKKLELLINMSKDNNLDYIPNGANGNSKLIFMIDSKEKINNKVDKKEDKRLSFWDKVKGLFN